MASVVSDPNGFHRVVFKGLDGKRRPLRLGKCSEKFAIAVGDHVEAILNQALMPSRPLPRATAEWLAEMSPVMEKKLVAVGLIHPRESTKLITLGEFLDAYLVRRSDVKDGTRVFYGHTRRNLIDVFGADRPLTSITAGDADDFRRYLQQHCEQRVSKVDGKLRTNSPLAAATVARRCSLARTFFRDAVRRKLIDANPFEDIGGGNKANPERSHFIDKETIAKVIDACPNAEWRLLVALSRFGGVRVPSEALTLHWRDIDWSADRMLIHSPKTEHHAGKATRVVPLFAELRPYLEDVFDQAPEGSDFVLPSLQREAAQLGDWRAVNLRTRFQKIVKKAGQAPWPRLWHNLRASRQTELTESFPAHVVSAWLGNSERIAAAHYLQVLDSHFQKAASIPARGTPASDDFESHRISENAEIPHFCGISGAKVGDTGFEPVTSTV
ncbi:MAG: tyrosine-type recombinase/integrase [Planctomycetia bacterium]|nr:tyrosine-type recombinase/integrase [Planctomycetia bacterium]